MPRPGAHIDAHLFAHEPAEDEGRRGQYGDGAIGDRGRLSGPEVCRQRRCVGEIHDPRAASPEGDGQIDAIFDRPLRQLFGRPWTIRQPDLRVAVAVDEPVDMLEQVGPHRLRTGIAAPGAPDRTGDEEQPDPRHDEQARDIIEFMRPDLDLEHVETPVREVDEHRLIGRVRTTIPADPRRSIIDRQGHRHDRPFEAAEGAVHRFRVNTLPRYIKRRGLAGEILRAGHRFRVRRLHLRPPGQAPSRRRPANRHRPTTS